MGDVETGNKIIKGRIDYFPRVHNPVIVRIHEVRYFIPNSPIRKMKEICICITFSKLIYTGWNSTIIFFRLKNIILFLPKANSMFWRNLLENKALEFWIPCKLTRIDFLLGIVWYIRGIGLFLRVDVITATYFFHGWSLASNQKNSSSEPQDKKGLIFFPWPLEIS